MTFLILNLNSMFERYSMVKKNDREKKSNCKEEKFIRNILIWACTDKPVDKCTTYTTQNLLRITFSFNDLMLKKKSTQKRFFL